MPIAIGIDLGTTYCAVARVSDAGLVEMITNNIGKVLTPSAIYFTPDAGVEVGESAKQAQQTHPDRVVTAIKRKMGTQDVLGFDGTSYSPEALSAVILRRLVADAASALNVPTADLQAVITVPAYFGVAEREATAAAATIAGIECLDLVAEPVAAALSYGLSPETPGTFAVYDLGGGTFDVTVVEMTDSGAQAIATDGSTELGGLNWDKGLMELFVDELIAATGDEDAPDDESLLERLYSEVEDAKKRLSVAASASINLIHRGDKVKLTVTREQFELKTRTLVDMTLEVLDRAFAESKRRGARSVDTVVLVGGSSRMPAIAQALSEHSHTEVLLRDPDHAVAKGAAIHAMALTGAGRRLLSSGTDPRTEAAQRLLASQPVRSVLPRALGFRIHDSYDASGTRMVVTHVVAPNTPLPIEGQHVTLATIVDNQDRVRVELYEQAGSVPSEEVEHNRRVIDGELSELPALRSGSPIELTISVGLSGRMVCTALEPTTGKSLTLESYVDGVGDSSDIAREQSALSRLELKE